MGVEGAGAAANREFELASRLAAIVESSADAIIGFTLDRVITSWNAGAERMFGYAPGEIIGRNTSLLIPPDTAADLAPILERVRRGEGTEHFAAKRLRKDGSIIDVSSTVSPIRDASGAVVGMSTVARDMTERIRAEAERRALERELDRAERLESLGQLAGGIAHDFNNLLGVIAVSVDLAEGSPQDHSGVAGSLTMIRDATERAADLTRQLLLFSRRQPGEPRVLDVTEALADIEQLLARSIGEEVQLEFRLGAGPLLVLADQTRLDQVVMNLAVNARDAMPDGGVLRITAALVGEPDPDPPEEAIRDWVRIAVTDTGVGMTDDVRARALEPFFTTKEDKGTGLGLATVHGIVTNAGGALRIESNRGSGTTIEVRLPAVDAGAVETVPVRRDTPAAPRPAAGERILLVEDEGRLREPLRRLLSQAGFVVTVAEDGAEALAQLEAGLVVDIVVTDVVMPRVTGPELARELASRRPEVPVLFMSGYTDGEVSGSIDRARLVYKPFRSGELLSALDRALAWARNGTARNS